MQSLQTPKETKRQSSQKRISDKRMPCSQKPNYQASDLWQGDKLEARG